MKKLLAVVAFFSLASSVCAEVNFDRGVDFQEFVKDIVESAPSQSRSPLLEMKASLTEKLDLQGGYLSRCGKKSPKAGAGYIHGPYHPRIIDSQIYKNGQAYPPLLRQQENSMAYELLADWDYLNTVRDILLDEAYALNTRDSGLYAEGEKLNQEAEAFKREIAQFNANVNAYNQQCAGRPFSWYCVNWSNNIDTWRADLTKRLNIHYKKVEDWETRVDELYSLADELVIKILGWENRINGFISAAKALLNKGDCTYDQWKPLYDAVKAACNGGHCYSEQNCDTLKSNLAINQACYDARVKIRDQCYINYPDSGHNQAIDDAQKAINNCLKIISEQHCQGLTCLEPVPTRRYGQ